MAKLWIFYANSNEAYYRLIQDPELDGVFNAPQFLHHIFVVPFVDVGDYIPNVFIGFQVLPHNVDAIAGQHLVDLGQDAGNIVMDVD